MTGPSTEEMAQAAGYQWLMSKILAIWEAEIGRIKVQGQPGQTVCMTASLE
jgi:hypothetical protein